MLTKNIIELLSLSAITKDILSYKALLTSILMAKTLAKVFSTS